MFNTEIQELIDRIKTDHPIFTDGFFFDPNNENGFRGFTDAISNYFYIEINEDETGTKYFFNESLASGCLAYNVTFSANIYFVLDTCKNKSLATQKLLTSLYYPWIVQNTGDNEYSIYAEMMQNTLEDGEELKPFSSYVKLIRFTVNGTFLFTGNTCEDGLCADDCC